MKLSAVIIAIGCITFANVIQPATRPNAEVLRVTGTIIPVGRNNGIMLHDTQALRIVDVKTYGQQEAILERNGPFYRQLR